MDSDSSSSSAAADSVLGHSSSAETVTFGLDEDISLLIGDIGVSLAFHLPPSLQDQTLATEYFKQCTIK